MPRGCWSRSSPRAMSCDCATSWHAPASTRACASACSTPSTSAASSIRWARITTGWPREVRRRRLYRIGYAAQGQDTSFDREVRDGLMRAAEREHVELIVVDNRYQPKIALRTADYLIKEQVDLVIEFQTDETDRARHRHQVPGGQHSLHRHRYSAPRRDLFRRQQLSGGPDGRALPGPLGQEVLGWRAGRDPDGGTASRGSLPKARIRGMQTRHRRSHPRSRALPHSRVDGDGQFQTTLERVRKHLRESKARRVLVGAANDSSALGALRAYRRGGPRQRVRRSSDRTPSRKPAPNCARRTPA